MARAEPLLRAKEVAERALPTIVLSRLVDGGQLRRLARGVYAIPDVRSVTIAPWRKHRSGSRRGWFACIRPFRFTALLLSDSTRMACNPTELPRTSDRSAAVAHGSHVRRSIERRCRNSSDRRRGRSRFNASKAVADCFKYRNKIGPDIAIKALRRAWMERNVALDELVHYALINRVSNAMRPYLDSIVS
jgi:hypothetical protein